MYSQKEKLASLCSWTGIIITYLFVEWIYNQHLLEVLLVEKISPNSFEATEVFGKLIASFGINFFLIKLFRYSQTYFYIGLIVVYCSLTFLFNYAINSFSNEFRHTSYYSMLYRVDVLKNNDRNILLTNDSQQYQWYEKSLLMSYFIFTMNESEWKIYENKVNAPINKKLNNITSNFDNIYKDYKKVSLLKTKLDQGYQSYSKLMQRYEKYRYGTYKKVALKEFLKRTGGLSPDLTEEEFFKKAPGGKTYNEFANKIFYEGEPDLSSPIIGRDIPLNLNKSEFKKYLYSLINEKKAQLAPSIDNIRDNMQSETSVAVLIIPPISILLSLVSILLNIFLLLISWLLLIPRIEDQKNKIVIVLSCIYVGLLFSFVHNNSNIIAQHKEWKSMESKATQSYPVLSYVWKFTFNMEPFICPQKGSNIVKKITIGLYNR